MIEGHCPNGHQNHADCNAECPCWAPGQGGKTILSIKYPDKPKDFKYGIGKKH